MSGLDSGKAGILRGSLSCKPSLSGIYGEGHQRYAQCICILDAYYEK